MPQSIALQFTAPQSSAPQCSAPRTSAPILARQHILRKWLFVATVLAALLFASALRSDQPAAAVVGSVEGTHISMKWPISVEVTHSVSRPLVSSGGAVSAKSGLAPVA